MILLILFRHGLWQNQFMPTVAKNLFELFRFFSKIKFWQDSKLETFGAVNHQNALENRAILQLHTFFGLVAGILLITACSSSPKQTQFGSEVDVSELSKAEGAAYAADAFTFRKEQPIRPPVTSDVFFKQCELNSRRVSYSRTAYSCEYR